MVRVGIIGFGKMGQLRAQTLESIEGCSVAKIFDVTIPEGNTYPVAKSGQEIIDDPNLDAIVVCTPNFLIKDTTIKSLLAGKHVFCEKPPAMNANEVREIGAARDASGKILMYGFNHRRHAAVMKMKELVESGEMGNVLWMRGRYGKSVDGEYLQGWRAKKELAGGGIILDQGIHMLDLFLHIGGQEFDEVHAMVSSLYWKTEGIEDNVFAMMRNTETGMCAQLHSTMTQWRHLFSLEVFLEKGYMVLNGLKTGSGTYGEEILTVARNRSKAPAATWEEEERFEYPVDVSWASEAEEFYAAITNSRPQTHGTIQNALAVMKLIDNIYANDTHVKSTLHSELQASKPE